MGYRTADVMPVKAASGLCRVPLMGAAAPPFHPTGIVKQLLRVGQSGGLKEHDQVVVGVSQAQNLVPTASVHAHPPTATFRRPVHNDQGAFHNIQSAPSPQVGAARYTGLIAGHDGADRAAVNGFAPRRAAVVRAEAARSCLPPLPAARGRWCSAAGETDRGTAAQLASLLRSVGIARDRGGERQQACTTIRSRGPRGFRAEPSISTTAER